MLAPEVRTLEELYRRRLDASRDLETYRGVPVGGRTLTTTGLTWHQLDDDGRIVRETTYWNDTPVLQELGIPLVTPRYWEAGFDPASLTG